MQDAYWIDKARVRASFDRAASTYDAAAILQKNVREEMLSRLDLIKTKPLVILDAGCGTGHGSIALQQRFPKAQVISLDLALGMLNKTHAQTPWLSRLLGKKGLVCADIEHLPIANQSVDLIWSNLVVQWCNNLDQVLSEMKRILTPDGLVMFSTFGPDTLKELRMASADERTHVSRFIDMHDIGDALTRAGFTAPVLDVEHYTLTYDTVKSVMQDLKSIGARNATDGRARGLLGKEFLRRLSHQYESFRRDGKLPATYEVVYAHAWQPKQMQTLPAGFAPIQFKPKA